VSWLDRLLGGSDAERSAREVAPRGDPELVRAVEVVIDELRPMLRADAGDVELVAVEEGWVTVRLRGACESCGVRDMTVHGALEPRLKERLPWVLGVRSR
jgi:Fe-S cluster biogenesis protein NfuA